jgi:hypothetical protein
VAADQQVLVHRELREDLAALGNVAHAGGDDAVGRDVRDLAALVADASARRSDEPGHRAERRRLPGAVRAQQGDDLARRHAQGQPVEGAPLAVCDGDVVELQDRSHASSSLPR